MSAPGPHGQDLPPRSRYPEVQFRRHLPGRGFSAGIVLLGTVGVMLWGHWRNKGAIDERRELDRENRWSRIYLIPVLQAEHDRDLFRRQCAEAKREYEVMKDVPGWRPSQNVYHGQTYVTQSYVLDLQTENSEPQKRGWFWQKKKGDEEEKD